MRHRVEAILLGYADRTTATPLAPRERAKLIGILSRLASPYANERAIAGLLASAFVTKHALMWSDLITFLRPAGTSATAERPQQDRRRAGRREWRGYCRRRRTLVGNTLNLFL
jgi:hypothetical protein